jgi:exodeoxyribonuclease VII large subunit
MTRIFTVSEITEAVSHTLQAEFPFVWVRGQVTNMSCPGSGHIYFSLKDHSASLAVVWFKSNQQCMQESSGGDRIDPLTGEVTSGRGFVLEEGMEILVAGRMNVYAPRGSYQLIAELVQEQGLGDLYLAFEAMKNKLAGQGYFDPGRKRLLPRHPRRVAVVTSPQGAAVRDFLKIAHFRGLGGQIRIYPSLVQGDKAPQSIIGAMDQAVADDWAEILVLIRGGGSIEDLWAFNTEPVARAIFTCPLPVLSGVGHEVDTTIADLVADVRAATPTHAAQMLYPERESMIQTLDESISRLLRAVKARETQCESQLAQLEQGLDWLSPQQRIDRLMERLTHATRSLGHAGVQWVDRQSALLDREGARLRTVLGPGYWRMQENLIMTWGERLVDRAQGFVDRRITQTEVRQTRLDALDPHAPLKRGYSLVRKPDGSFLRDGGEVSPEELLEILPARGRVVARVIAQEDEGEK